MHHKATKSTKTIPDDVPSRPRGEKGDPMEGSYLVVFVSLW